MTKSLLASTLGISILFSTFMQNAWSAQITKMKGNKVLINLDGATYREGEELFALNANGKKLAIIKITQVKGEKAIGEITKGKAEEGYSVVAKSAAGSTAAHASTAESQQESADESQDDSSNTRTRMKRKKIAGGVLLGYAMNTMSLTAQYQPASGALRSASTNLTGSSFSIKGFGDYDLMPEVTIRGAFGLEPFAAKGDASTGGQNICGDGASSSCSVSFNYITFEGSIHYNFLTGKNRAWVGAGYAFMFTASKSLNIPNLQTAGSTNQMLLVSVGADFGIGKKGHFIPVVAEYGYIPGDNVKASAIYLRAGYGIPF